MKCLKSLWVGGCVGVCEEMDSPQSTSVLTAALRQRTLPEDEEEALLGLRHQVSCVCGPCEVKCDVDAQEWTLPPKLNIS